MPGTGSRMRAGARKNEEKSPLGPQNAECFQIALERSSRRRPINRRHRALPLNTTYRAKYSHKRGTLTAGKARAAAPALLKEDMGIPLAHRFNRGGAYSNGVLTKRIEKPSCID